MAVQIVVEAALNALLQGLFDKLALPFLKSFGLLCGVEEEVKKLSRTLSTIQAVLNDAEERQIKDESVKIWLRELKDVAYDAEDLVDEFTTEALRSKTESGVHTRKRKKVHDFFSYFISNQNMSQRLREIRERLDEIAKDRHAFHLREGDARRRRELEVRRHTSSVSSESYVFGRDGDLKKIIELLEVSFSSTKDVSVVPIVGMGGLGKTTLAQLVYNNEEVEKHFEIRAWVCVSEDFDVRSLTKAIIESATRRPCYFNDLDPLQVSLKEIMDGKRFLLVLDDVWNENRADWEALRAPLKVGSKGSKIVVTTRSEKVSLIMGTISAHCLDGLTNDDCWSLFKQCAFEDRNCDAYPHLEAIGKEMVKKCKGLPLAAKTLGGLLHGITDEYEWNIVLQSEIWNLPDDRNDILPALRLSYHHLPAKMKQCFAYCSIFPKDYEFKKEDLVLLWMAEGFIQLKEGRRMEDVGNEYFDDLLSRSFFQYAHTNPLGQPIYKMHDLIHDLALTIPGEECFRVEIDKSINISRKVRHLSFLHDHEKPLTFKAFLGAKSLRTFISLHKDKYSKFHIQQIPLDLFLNLRCLRVLDLRFTKLKELPNSVGNLQHLRYVNLFSTDIENLPESITSLLNLQTLELGECNSLQGLPRNTCNLINLRHLNVPLLIPMPPDIGKLSCLQTLSTFTVGRETGCGIEQLKGLIDLRGNLTISMIENVIKAEEANAACLKNKQHLKKLALDWNDVHLDSIDRVVQEVIEALQPHKNLKVLEIGYYYGDHFPSWMTDSSLYNLVSVTLNNCKKCRNLPPLGQLPFLEDLEIWGLDGVKFVGREFYGTGLVKGFPSLQTLSLRGMPKLEEWCGAEEGEFPRLRQLEVVFACKLRVLPLLTPVLEKLKIVECERLVSLPPLPFIRDLVLLECDEGILNSLPCLTSLNSLKISYFSELNPLRNGWLQHFAALKKLELERCSNITSFLENSGLQYLSSLEHLMISHCKQLPFMPKGLQNLSSLQDLKIVACNELISLIETELPTSLTHLQISNCTNLVSLPKVLKNLTSLKNLEIDKNPQLESFPEEGLPTSLQYLSITDSPMLQLQCKKESGRDWLKIAHIPNIHGQLVSST